MKVLNSARFSAVCASTVCILALGGVLPIMAHTGTLRPKGVPFSGFRYMKGQGNLSFGSVKGPKGLTDEFYGFIKSRKRSIFVVDSYLKHSAFTAVKRDVKF